MSPRPDVCSCGDRPEVCDKCGADQSKVIDSRPSQGLGRMRRRECIKCRHWWTTFESRIDPSEIPPHLARRLFAS